MSGISTLQGGQADLELAAVDAAVLLAPYNGTSPITNLEATGGGLNTTLIGSSSQFVTVGNWTKDEGVTLTNNPTINDIKSHGKGSPTRKLASEAAKGITYTPQETKLINLQNAWGFPVSAVTGPSAHGGITIAIPELPTNLLWRVVLLAWDSYNGNDIFKYWIANRASVGDRKNMQMKDSNVDESGVSLSFETDPAVPGTPVIFGVCGTGWQDLITNNKTGFASFAALTSISVSPATATLSLAGTKTQQLTVTDSNSQDRTASATYGTSDETKATVSSTGLVTGVATGSATITANYGGLSDVCDVTVTA